MVDANGDLVLLVVTGLVVAVVGTIGVRIAWREFGDHFEERYGSRGTRMLLAFLLSFPLLVVAHLFTGRRDDRHARSESDSQP